MDCNYARLLVNVSKSLFIHAHQRQLLLKAIMQLTFQDSSPGYRNDSSNRLFNMPVSAWPIRTVIRDQSKVHYCGILFPFWCGCNPSSKSSSNSSRFSERLSVDIIKIKIQFLSLNLFDTCGKNYFSYYILWIGTR